MENNWQLKTPVAFIVFKRPDTTEKVFEAIRKAKPPKLLVIADGPRADRPGEAENCAATRAVIERVDWECEVLKNYSGINLGCKQRVSSGLNWLFDLVEEAIILEDDCLPHPSFFRFCEELLTYYRDEQRITSISGQNVQFERRRSEYSYYFSHYYHSWGWATWRRAWQHYDVQMQLWSGVRDSGLLDEILTSKRAVDYWKKTFQSTYDGYVDTWDFQWIFASWLQNGLTIIPNVNLISNIGFSPFGSTNTTTTDSPYASMPTAEMMFPLQHPATLVRNVEADKFTQDTLYNPSWLTRAKAKIKRSLIKTGMTNHKT